MASKSKSKKSDNASVAAQPQFLSAEFSESQFVPEFAVLALNDITLGQNIRTGDLPDVGALAQSIKQIGLQQPLTVKRTADNQYVLVDGYRRYAALRSLMETGEIEEGFEIPVAVKEYNDAQATIVALSLNDQRASTNPVDFANAVLQLQKQTNYDVARISNILGRKASYVEKHLRFAQDASSKIKEFVNIGVMTVDAALAAMDNQLPEQMLETFATKAKEISKSASKQKDTMSAAISAATGVDLKEAEIPSVEPSVVASVESEAAEEHDTKRPSKTVIEEHRARLAAFNMDALAEKDQATVRDYMSILDWVLGEDESFPIDSNSNLNEQWQLLLDEEAKTALLSKQQQQHQKLEKEAERLAAREKKLKEDAEKIKARLEEIKKSNAA